MQVGPHQEYCMQFWALLFKAEGYQDSMDLEHILAERDGGSWSSVIWQRGGLKGTLNSGLQLLVGDLQCRAKIFLEMIVDYSEG